jgi:hypothetical protein
MKQVIWKFTLKLEGGVQTMMAPRDAEILCAREQHEQVCVWFRGDPTALQTERQIAIVGTGHPAPMRDESRYLGTAMLDGGDLVLHVFERT